jgi:hypothetical protein
MKRTGWIVFRNAPFLMIGGLLACGGGGGGGGGSESFTVAGLWSVAPTSEPGTASPATPECRQIAEAAGRFQGTVIEVRLEGNGVSGTETGSGLAFDGTVDDADQSFTLQASQPICNTVGACTACGSVAADFLDAGGDTADVNVVVVATGNSACPGQCTVAFQTNGSRS